MCLLSVFFCDDPSDDQCQVIIASNRDEFLLRPTKQANFWGENNDCIGGLDASAEAADGGGTWLAMSKRTGRIASLVNIAQKSGRNMEKRSRGSLVTEYLTSDVDTAKYLSTINAEKHDYNNFSLVLMEKREDKYKAYLLSSTMEDPIQEVKAGVCVIGNSHYQKPWKKVTYAENNFKEIVRSHNSVSNKEGLISALYDYLGDKTSHFPDERLTAQLGDEPGVGFKPDGTKVGPFVTPEWLSSVYVTSNLGYGTRTHTLIMIDKHGNCEFREKTLDVKFPKPSTDWLQSAWNFKIGDCEEKS